MHDTHTTTEPLRHTATDPDATRPGATGDDSHDDYISLKEARGLFLASDRPITERTLQRSCNKEHLSCRKVVTAEGEKWFALRSSVHHRIAELVEFDRLREPPTDATGRDTPPPVAQQNTTSNDNDHPRPAATDEMSSPDAGQDLGQPTADDTPRQDAAERDMPGQGASAIGDGERELYDRLLTSYEERITGLVDDKENLQTDKSRLTRQLEAKDRQIERFFESEHDTKTLLGSLQSLFNAIWPNADKGAQRFAPMREALDSGLEMTQPTSTAPESGEPEPGV
jgi:hypothetical protein